MKHSLVPLFLFLVLGVQAANLKLATGDMELTFTKVSTGYQTHLIYNGTDMPFIEAGKPAYLEVQGKPVSGYYTTVNETQGTFICVADLKSARGSQFRVTDTYTSPAAGQISLHRKVQVVSKKAGDNYFLSAFGIATTDNAKFTNNEYLVPGVLYKGYFDAACNTPTYLPQDGDAWFLYRDDRTPLPFVMSRSKNNGTTITLAHQDSECRTVVADANGESYSAGYQFGASGLYRDTANNLTYQEVVYPGTTKSTKSGKGNRFHPVDTSVKHSYSVFLSISQTDTYAEAAKQSWNEVFSLYNPKVYFVLFK